MKKVLVCKEKEPLEIRPRTVAEILQIDADREKLKGEIEELKRTITVYEPYGDFDPELAKKILEAGVDLSSVAELPAKPPEMRLSDMRAKLTRQRRPEPPWMQVRPFPCIR